MIESAKCTLGCKVYYRVYKVYTGVQSVLQSVQRVH